jgi:hypothetical protein
LTDLTSLYTCSLWSIFAVKTHACPPPPAHTHTPPLQALPSLQSISLYPSCPL